MIRGIFRVKPIKENIESVSYIEGALSSFCSTLDDFTYRRNGINMFPDHDGGLLIKGFGSLPFKLHKGQKISIEIEVLPDETNPPSEGKLPEGD